MNAIFLIIQNACTCLINTRKQLFEDYYMIKYTKNPAYTIETKVKKDKKNAIRFTILRLTQGQ